jgi:hypothetical protein
MFMTGGPQGFDSFFLLGYLRLKLHERFTCFPGCLRHDASAIPVAAMQHNLGNSKKFQRIFAML